MLAGFLAGVLGGDLGGVGVDFRLPLKPWLPDDDQAMALPCASVIVITVLLNVAATWATPEVMFFRSFLRGRAAAAAGFAMEYVLSVGEGRGALTSKVRRGSVQITKWR
jgi:hypothetical protein